MYLICLIFVLPKVVCVNPVWGPVYSELGPVVDSVIYIYYYATWPLYHSEVWIKNALCFWRPRLGGV